MEERIWYTLSGYRTILEHVTDVPISISGELVYFSVLGQQVIILNSLKVVNDLFDKRSHMYSDRPLLPMRDMYVVPGIGSFGSLIISPSSLGWKFVLGLMHYGDEWRQNRRILHQKYRPDAALAHRPTQLAKIHELLRNLLLDPENFEQHYK
jgi:hypothetical protein